MDLGARFPCGKITGATMTLDSTGTSISVLSLGSKSFRDVAHCTQSCLDSSVRHKGG